MAKVTSKLQVTVPKTIADRYGIEPGSEIEWQAAEDVIRVIPPGRSQRTLDREARLKSFDTATQRQHGRQKRSGRTRKVEPKQRGWRREDLYGRGGSG